MRIYLDSCCFNRPFDGQDQIRIRLETEAKLSIQEQVFNEQLELVWSYILDFENQANPHDERCETISEWANIASVQVEPSDELHSLAESILDTGLRPKRRSSFSFSSDLRVFTLSCHRLGYLEKIKGSRWHSNHESNRFYHTTGRIMITEAELKIKGVKALSDALGPVDAERFVSLLQKHVFDYTSWQKTLFEDLTLDELNNKAKESWGKKKT